MKIVRIKKHLSANTIIFNIVIYDELTEDEINDRVEEFCENDDNGYYNGYSYEWETLIDDKEICKVLENESKNIKSDITRLKEKLEVIENHLITSKYKYIIVYTIYHDLA